MSRLIAALVAVAMGLLASAKSEAFPTQRVHDRLWGVSANWITFTVPRTPGARTQIEFLMTTQTQCTDGVGRALCQPSGTGVVHLRSHLFDASGAMAATSTVCQSRNCFESIALTPGVHRLMIHSDLNARGIASLTLRVRVQSSPAFLGTYRETVSDNVMLDVGTPPASGFDVHSVLMPDGPASADEVTGVPSDPGNTANDWLGVDSTEAWLFDDQFRVLAADLTMSGVGPAALLLNAQQRLGRAVRYVMVRPYQRPPFVPLTITRQPIVVDNQEYARAPGPGRMRVVLNERVDTDGDGLSDSVERELGLCDGTRGYSLPTGPGSVSCLTESEVRLGGIFPGRSLAFADPRDTDSDGIADGFEVLGTDTVAAALPSAVGGRPTAPLDYQTVANAAQTLPLWGFSPRHKDMLIEIDRVGDGSLCRTPTSGCSDARDVYPSPSYTDPDAAMRALWNFRRAWASLPAQSVANPDGTAGIEVHFDVRILSRMSSNHGFVPRFIMQENGDRLGLTGLVTYVPNGGSGGRCSCDQSTLAPDPRHGGLAHYYPGVLGGGNTGCNGEISAQIGFPDLVGSHEFGHVMGLSHGGPDAACFDNPFAPRTATDTAREDKLVQPSIMNYATRYRSSLVELRERFGGQTFSVGLNLASPLPRLLSQGDRAVFGWPEDDTLLGRSTAYIASWSSVRQSYTPRECSALGPVACVDFNANGAVGQGSIATGLVEPSTPFIAGGTKPFWVSYYVCDNVDALGTARGLVDAGNRCCPTGSFATGMGACVRNGTVDSMVPASLGSLQTLFNQSMQGALVVRTQANAERRMISLHQDDLSANNSTNRADRPYSGVGKIRWTSLGKIEFEVPRRVSGQCTGDSANCAVLPDGWRGRGDVRVRAPGGQLGVARMDGPGTITAASLDNGPGALESVILGTVSRTGPFCTDGLTPPTAMDCPWGFPRFYLGTSDALDPRQTPVATDPALQDAQTFGFDFQASGLAIASWSVVNGTPTRFLIVVRRASDNVLLWRQCDVNGMCTGPAAPLLDGDGNAVLSRGQIALAVRPAIGTTAPRLGLVRTVNTAGVSSLAFREIAIGSSPVLGEASPILRPGSGSAALPVAAESALSAAFERSGNLVVGFETPDLKVSVGTTMSDPLGPGPIRLEAGNTDWGASRRIVRGPVVGAMATTDAFIASPGNTWSVFRDGRPTAEAVGTGPSGERDPALDQTFTDAVRAVGVEYFVGPLFRFAGRVDSAAFGPRFDYDESMTLAFALCHTLESSSRGRRGGLLTPRAGYAQVNSRVICPGASAWPTVPPNPIVPEFVVDPNRLSQDEQMQRIADLVMGPQWYGAIPTSPTALPSVVRDPAPVNQCSAGGEDGAWMQWAMSQQGRAAR
ncbi:MAG: hypothetical protein Q8Q09_21465 [Deltaproteobacteria bacterium]|nr:hypothetical protein [Deltaproteobacteria bacterium]